MNWSENELLALAAGVERSTTHPIAKALVQAAAAADCRYAEVCGKRVLMIIS